MQKTNYGISYRAMKTCEGKNWVFYRIPCSCMYEGHDVTLEFDLDPNWGMATLTMYTNVSVDHTFNLTGEYRDSFKEIFRKIKERIKDSFKILLTGRIEGSGEFIIGDEKHIQSFIAVLEEGRKHIHRRTKNEKKEGED